MNRTATLVVACAAMMQSGSVGGQPMAGVAVRASEMDEARRWMAAKFDGTPDPGPSGPGLVVLANNGPVQLDARGGKPLKIGDREYKRGLYCHAVSRVRVLLPAPGKALMATVGVDAHAGGGSIEFGVTIGQKQVYRSGAMHIADAPLPVRVNLGGAREFTIEVGDAGDGISCDQADWAEARATMQDGRTIQLSDLPLRSMSTPYSTDLPFSFTYGGRAFADIVKSWEIRRTSILLDDHRTEHVVTAIDPATRLEARAVGIAYNDFPTVEWTLYVRNLGSADTPVLTNIRALDTRFDIGADTDTVLHRNNGTLVNRHDYEPHDTPIKAGDALAFTPSEGRPCAEVFPYFNVEWAGQGVIAVVGWPGKWSAAFERDKVGALRLTAGQDATHFRLHPGEEVRTPLIVLQFWDGDAGRSQNVWRRWMLAHSMPRPNGKLPPPEMPAVSGNQFAGLLCNEADEKLYIDRYAEERIPITHWWMDAGWYVNKGDWTSTGTWEIDRKRFPSGLRAISAYVHKRGMKLIVWFEPERVTAGSRLADNHPEWVLGGAKGGLLDLGNPEAWKWTVDTIDRLITEQGIDVYRQDFNMDPLPYWRAHDAEDRQGITEIRHIEGYLALWDELLKRHPGLMIDSCASGGHRDDLETLRRSVPLLRSDYLFDPVGEQCHTYGLAAWVPYWGTGFIDFDAYIARGCMGPNMTLSVDARRKDLDWNLLRRLTAQWREIAPCLLGDYYPLTSYTLAEDQWIAWQFDRPEAGEGIVQVFRRPESVYESARLRLRGLDPSATYVVEDMDTRKSVSYTGKTLMDAGLPVAIGTRPGSALVRYRKANGAPLVPRKQGE